MFAPPQPTSHAIPSNAATALRVNASECRSSAIIGNHVRRALVVSIGFLTATACGIQPRDRVDWQEPRAPLFDAGPYIVIESATSVRIALAAELAAAPVFEWWLPGSPEIAPGTVTGERVHDLWVAHLQGLPAATEIAYRVTSVVGQTPTYRFRVGVHTSEAFRFAAFGDTRSGHDVHRSIVEAIARERIDFVVNTGDMVERGGKEAQWTRFFRIERPLLVDTPVVAAVGNHDMNSRHYFEHYFLRERPGAEHRYFSYDWGNLRIVVVDAEIETRRGSEQFAYLDQQLADGVKKGMLMVLALHQPPFSSGYHGSDEHLRAPIQDLARRHGVELVLTGHDHDYERTKPIDGTTYIVTGSAGAPIRPIHPHGFTAHARTEPHYVLVDVDSDHLTVRAVNLRGDVFDSAVIQANPPRNK